MLMYHSPSEHVGLHYFIINYVHEKNYTNKRYLTFHLKMRISKGLYQGRDILTGAL